MVAHHDQPFQIQLEILFPFKTNFHSLSISLSLYHSLSSPKFKPFVHYFGLMQTVCEYMYACMHMCEFSLCLFAFISHGEPISSEEISMRSIPKQNQMVTYTIQMYLMFNILLVFMHAFRIIFDFYDHVF